MRRNSWILQRRPEAGIVRKGLMKKSIGKIQQVLVFLICLAMCDLQGSERGNLNLFKTRKKRS